MSENLGLILTVAGFVLNLIVIAVGGTWKLAQLEASIRKTIEASRKEIDNQLEQQSREFGETASALRTKIHNIEIWARDTFMRRDGFYRFKEELTAGFKEIKDELKADLNRLEGKIDAVSKNKD